MIKLMTILVGIFLVAASPSFAEMMDMDKHMSDMHGKKGVKSEAKNKAKNEVRGLVQEAEAADVTVKVEYANPAAKAPTFKVVLDTHSVDLEGYEFKEIVVVRYGVGAEFKPDAVTETGSGHHREATVEFKAEIPASSKTVELVVKGVAGVEERVFKFDVQAGQ